MVDCAKHLKKGPFRRRGFEKRICFGLTMLWP